MTNEEYMTKFLELLRYVPYLKDEKSRVQIFVSGFPLEFRDSIENDEPRLLEEVIGKLKNCYEKSRHKIESQQVWKGKDKSKGKWQPKRTRPWDASEKDNVVPYKKFNGPQPREEKNTSDGRRHMQCWKCGKENLKKYFPYNQGGSLKSTVLRRGRQLGMLVENSSDLYNIG